MISTRLRTCLRSSGTVARHTKHSGRKRASFRSRSSGIQAYTSSSGRRLFRVRPTTCLYIWGAMATRTLMAISLSFFPRGAVYGAYRRTQYTQHPGKLLSPSRKFLGSSNERCIEVCTAKSPLPRLCRCSRSSLRRVPRSRPRSGSPPRSSGRRWPGGA